MKVTFRAQVGQYPEFLRTGAFSFIKERQFFILLYVAKYRFFTPSIIAILFFSRKSLIIVYQEVTAS